MVEKTRAAEYLPGSLGGPGDLRSGEIVDRADVERLLYIAKLGAVKLVGHRPRGEHRRSGIALGQLRDSRLVHADHARISEIVLRGKSVGRIDEQPGHKCPLRTRAASACQYGTRR